MPQTTTADPADAGVIARTRTGPLIMVLGALTAIAPLATDMYVPGFPEMTGALRTTDSAVQLTMTTFLLGFVIGQLLFGPLSDSLGRRRLLLVNTLLFVVFSLACALAPTIALLVAARLLAGVTGAAGAVIARAVITDRFRGAAVARYFAILAMILGVAPATAPVFGGLILRVTGWRMIFGVITLIGVALVIAVRRWVPESLPSDRRQRGGLGATFGAMGRLLGQRRFLGYALALSFGSAALFGYISGSSFVFQDVYQLSATQYSLVFAVNAVGMMGGSAVIRSLGHRVPIRRLLAASLGVALVPAVVQVLLDVTGHDTVWSTWACLFCVLACLGCSIAAAMTLGQDVGHATSGAASALLGGGQFLLGALTSPLVGMWGTGSALPMAVIVLVGVGCALLALSLSRNGLRHDT